MIVPLEDIATVSLGYKSLQNNFYYLNQATIETFGVEKRFLLPIRRLSDLSPTNYYQHPKEGLWLFNCRVAEADLRGTGALRYIDAMAEKPATERKQSGKTATIRETLSAQGGRTWYAPKAAPSRHGIWIRKAFNGVFAPFIFDSATLVDQRCNSVAPKEGLTDFEVAAVLSSSLFAYSLEVNGSSTLGAGALEAATKAVRTFPVVDPRAMSIADRATLVDLARTCWKGETTDWSQLRTTPTGGLRNLDAWLLAKAGATTTVERLHKDLLGIVHERLHVAKDKTKTVKTKRTDSIGTVAQPIADRMRKKLALRSIPESFLPNDKLDLRIDLGGAAVRRINLEPLLGEVDVAVKGIDGSDVFEIVVNSATGEMICRGLLANRNSFQVTSDRNAANAGSELLMQWLSEIDAEIDAAVFSSSLGTGYEDILRREIISRIGVDQALFLAHLPERLVIDVEK